MTQQSDLGSGSSGLRAAEESENLITSAPSRMPEWDIPEDALGRAVFGPLGGIVEIGAVAATETWSPQEASVDELGSTRRDDVARLLEVIKEVGDFGGPVMEIFDELGYLRAHPVSAPAMLMWSSVYEDVSPRLGEPDTVRRMSRVGADLQLTRFLQALVNAAIARGPGVARGAALIAEALRIAVGLVGGALDEGPDSARGAMTVYRMWRVAFLADLLLPDSPARPDARALFREYAHALDALLGAPSRP
ncbi:hypothetical protein AB0I94_06450 [Streptomyces sp. NPDC050147]|uniref:hypothetical protein n=1 Tax=Streptomyces sp. NPDC050147 TaxID=3155513 RepID=UPI00342C51F5